MEYARLLLGVANWGSSAAIDPSIMQNWRGFFTNLLGPGGEGLVMPLFVVMSLVSAGLVLWVWLRMRKQSGEEAEAEDEGGGAAARFRASSTRSAGSRGAAGISTFAAAAVRMRIAPEDRGGGMLLFGNARSLARRLSMSDVPNVVAIHSPSLRRLASRPAPAR